MTADRGRLTTGIGAVLRHQRQLRGLSQQALADRAALSQAAVARIERGGRGTSLPILERLFAAIGLQIRVDLEPLDAHLDIALDRIAAQPVSDRIEELRLGDIIDRLAGIPFVFDGPTAALLQGAPLPGELVHLALAWADADAFDEWLGRSYGRRWHERWEEYGFIQLHPGLPGAHRWMTIVGELAVRMVPELPTAVQVRHGDRVFDVVSLPEVEVADRRTAEMLHRHRERLSAG
jgi:transcriptional regulator with XRE-family HTH domain